MLNSLSVASAVNYGSYTTYCSSKGVDPTVDIRETIIIHSYKKNLA